MRYWGVELPLDGHDRPRVSNRHYMRELQSLSKLPKRQRLRQRCHVVWCFDKHGGDHLHWLFALESYGLDKPWRCICVG